MEFIVSLLFLIASFIVLFYLFEEKIKRLRFYDKMRLYDIYLKYLDVCYHKGTHDFADFVEFQEYFYDLEYKGIDPFKKK